MVYFQKDYRKGKNMRRADRLFQIIQILRRQKITTASKLAEELAVSHRTIYRDITDLIGSGVPIRGESGTGYQLQAGYHLPPLMFSKDEIEALVLGIRTIVNWVDSDLKKAAYDVLAKVEAVLPDTIKSHIHTSPLFSPPTQGIPPQSTPVFRTVRDAIATRRKISFHYTRSDKTTSRRVIRPLCMAFFPPYWIVSGWCEMREDFRNFRLDRISNSKLTGRYFTDTPGRSLNDFLSTVVKQRE